MTRTTSGWPAAVGLILLSVIPLLGGAARLTELGEGAEVTPQNARFFASPVPVIVHAISASVFSLLGALQFVPGLRRRPWHRLSGRIVVAAGMLTALSALWMTVFYPPAPGNGTPLMVARLVFGAAMAACIVLGYSAIRRGRVEVHSAWMTRAYAIALGAGTQALMHVVWVPWLGVPTGNALAALMIASWLINLGVAELVIRRRRVVAAPLVRQPAASAAVLPK